MRRLLPVLAIFLVAAGCLEGAPTKEAREATPRRGVGAAPPIDLFAPVTLDELHYAAPPVAGPWMAAFWLAADRSLPCQATFKREMRTQGGTADTILMFGKGWTRPEVQGRIVHDYQRGDGFVAHAGAPAANQTLKRPTTPSAPSSVRSETSFRVDLPPVAFVVVGNAYLHNDPSRPSLDLRLLCESEFRLVHGVEGSALRVFGPEDFSGFVVDTEGGFGVQRDAQRSVVAREGLVAVLHEDANQGNAQYTTTKPDGSQQVDTLGNRIAVGPAGLWKFGLQRVSLSPGGEFRLFAFDIPIPSLVEPAAAPTSDE